jgi:hypothetical protein
MILYFAGNGLKPEQNESIQSYPKRSWGILLSYKDLKMADKTKVNSRFNKLIKRNESK